MQDENECTLFVFYRAPGLYMPRAFRRREFLTTSDFASKVK